MVCAGAFARFAISTNQTLKWFVINTVAVSAERALEKVSRLFHMSKKTPEHPWEKIPRGALVLFVWSLSEKRQIFRQFTAAEGDCLITYALFRGFTCTR